MADKVEYRIASVGDLARLWPEIKAMVIRGLQAGTVIISLGREKRSLSQNAKLWPMLEDVSKQLTIQGEFVSKEDWKQVFTAALRKQKIVPGIDGGFVVLAMSTSKMEKATFSMLIELIYAHGAENGVRWSEKALEIYEKYSENGNIPS